MTELQRAKSKKPQLLALTLLFAACSSEWEDDRGIWHETDNYQVFEDIRTNGFDYSWHLGIADRRRDEEMRIMIFSKPYLYELKVENQHAVEVRYCDRPGYNSRFVRGGPRNTPKRLDRFQTEAEGRISFKFVSDPRLCSARDVPGGREPQPIKSVKRSP